MSSPCFANRGGKCRVLDSRRCTQPCVFYRSPEEHQASLDRAYKRLASLDEYTQMRIAEKYYNRGMPWRKGGGV